MGEGRGKHRSGPVTLRCGKCKRGEDWRQGSRRPSDDRLVRTGGTWRVWKYHAKYNVLLIEILHEICGHVFWTNHDSANRKPLAQATQSG